MNKETFVKEVTNKIEGSTQKDIKIVVEEIIIEASKSPKFKAGKALKDAVKNA